MDELTLFDATPDLAVMRECSICGETKPLTSAFRKREGRAGRRRSECKRCQYAKEKTWRESQGPEYRRATTQWQLYRLPWDQYQEMLKQQGNACVICRQPFGDDPKLIVTDHDHSCDHPGKGRECCRACVRGVLCNRCNMFVGWIENEYRRLADVLGYLGVDGVVIWAHVMRDLGYERLRAVADIDLPAVAVGDE